MQPMAGSKGIAESCLCMRILRIFHVCVHSLARVCAFEPGEPAGIVQPWRRTQVADHRSPSERLWRVENRTYLEKLGRLRSSRYMLLRTTGSAPCVRQPPESCSPFPLKASAQKENETENLERSCV